MFINAILQVFFLALDISSLLDYVATQKAERVDRKILVVNHTRGFLHHDLYKTCKQGRRLLCLCVQRPSKSLFRSRIHEIHGRVAAEVNLNFA